MTWFSRLSGGPLPEVNGAEGKLVSCLCTQARLESPSFQAWVARIQDSPQNYHRKLWEYCYIAQALYEREMLAVGRQGLGFAVGREPLPALFAGLGSEVLATDLGLDTAEAASWSEAGQHAASLEELNDRGLCATDEFVERVRFRTVDMRRLPDNLGEFDYLWSSCSLEHLGTLAAGERFIFDSLRFLKSGGVAVHTTEFNLSSNLWTIGRGPDVIYRRRDIERIAKRLAQMGFRIDLDFRRGELPYDHYVDRPPYANNPHLTLELHKYVVTSIGLIIEAP